MTNDLSTGQTGVPRSRRSAREARTAGTPARVLPEVGTATPQSAPAADESGDVRCPTCSAGVPRGISWCSQCYSELPQASSTTDDDQWVALAYTARSSAARVTSGTVDPEPVEDDADPADLLVATPVPTRAERAELAGEESVPELDEELERLTETMLARMVADQPTGLRGVLSRGVHGAGGKTAAVVVGTLLFGGLGILLMSAVGSFL